VPAGTLVAHIPLVLEQRDGAQAVAGAALADRIAGIPKDLVVGYSFPLEAAGSVLAAILVLVGLALVARLAPRDRIGALVAGSLAAAVVLVPVVLALVGTDYVIARNAIVAIVPAAVCVGAGLAARRRGIGAAALRCALSATIAFVPASDRAYGRTDWRGVAEAIGSTSVPRAVVVTPYMSRQLWRPYLPELAEPDGEGVDVEEIVVVGLATEGGYSAGRLKPPAVTTPQPVAGFEVTDVERSPTFTIVRYGADRPTTVAVRALAGLALTDEQPGVLLQGTRNGTS
jgi:hypothetical protein